MQGRWDEAVEAMEAAHVLDAEGTASLLARARRDRAEAEKDSKAFSRAAFGGGGAGSALRNRGPRKEGDPA